MAWTTEDRRRYAPAIQEMGLEGEDGPFPARHGVCIGSKGRFEGHKNGCRSYGKKPKCG
jgi:hypothetical protein